MANRFGLKIDWFGRKKMIKEDEIRIAICKLIEKERLLHSKIQDLFDLLEAKIHEREDND